MAQDNGPHRYHLTEDSITIDGKTFGAGWLLISEDEYKSLTTANPAQGVSEAQIEKSARAICVALGHDPNDWVAYRSEARAALSAAIGAGGQAVADPWSEVREVMKKEPKFDWNNNQDGTARQHYVDRTRREFLDLLYGAVARAITHPAPSRQAVDVETIARAVDPDAWSNDLPVPTRGDTIRFYERRQASFETARRILSAISNPPAQPVAWPYGGCELSSDVPCNPFDCCEICQVPGAGKHANPPTQTARKDKY